MDCGNGCYDGDRVRIHHCEDNPPRWKFIYHDSDNTFQIKLRDHNLCMIAYDANTDVRLTGCSPDDEQQRFVSTPDGAYKTGPHFEITPMHKYERCLAQEHHPKPDEEIFQEYCINSRISTVGNWVKYYG